MDKLLLVCYKSANCHGRSHFRVLSRNQQPPNSAPCQDESSCLWWLWNLPYGIQKVFLKFALVWRNPLTHFQLESTTDCYCQKLFYGCYGWHAWPRIDMLMTKCPCLNEPQHICTCRHYFSLQTETVEVLRPLHFQIIPYVHMSIQDQ